ncbi:pickpocket protein 11 [Drosophila subpulchrella]|uniref:pickpocket protein 11 n=1 Tax=Drosophila subpulchrella TaxID=1486046 RepID=UPI0018A1AFC7|nr:pickpocket protein 11 [Drosophila subpulchrella]
MQFGRFNGFLLKMILYLVTFYHTLPFFASVSMSLLHSYLSSSVSFNLDTIYLNWNSTFPAITVCEIYNAERIWDLSDSNFGVEHDMHMDDFISEIVFYRGVCSSCEDCSKMRCPANFTLLVDVFRSKCHQLLVNCSYLNELFDCCDQFLPLPTEYGLCYSFNSHQARKVSHVQFTNNRMTGPGHLNFHAAADVQLYVHAPIDVPYQFSEGMIRETVLLGHYKELILNVIEVHNDESVQDLSMEQRRCRYGNEHVPERQGIYEFYSYSGCVVECTVHLQLENCNCTSHFMATPGQNNLAACDYRGLICLTRIRDKIMTERKSCECMSSCEEPEYNIIYNSADEDDEASDDVSKIRVALVELPTQRYVRRVTKTILDFLISLGGLVGLFFNTSALRIVEAIVICLRYRKTMVNWVKRFILGTVKYLQILDQSR